jgi:hypothetical protein
MWISKQNVIGRYAANNRSCWPNALELCTATERSLARFRETRQAILVRCTTLISIVVSLHRKKYCETTFYVFLASRKTVFAPNMRFCRPMLDLSTPFAIRRPGHYRLITMADTSATISAPSTAAAFFVFLWSTGFIVAKFGLPYAPPLTFLLLRCTRRAAGAGALRAGGGARRGPGRMKHIAVAGLLLQAGYLGGVWSAIKIGMPAGLSALIVGMQPILTAVAAPLIGERVRPRQWLGLLLGLGGVALVVAPRST